MQPGCDEIEFLISKSVDGEATPEENALVDSHVAGCDSCAYKLTSFMEMGALFSEAPLRAPDPQVRSGVFSEIHRLKEAERRAEESRAASNSRAPRPLLPGMGQTPLRPAARDTSLGSRVWTLGSPFAIMGTAVAVVIVLMTLAVPPGATQPPIRVASAASPIIPGGIYTREAPGVLQGDSSEHIIPSPVVTKGATYNVSRVSATVRSTATFMGDRIVQLSEPTAVLESGDPTKLSSWHVVRDPNYGYSVSYPPNWWTQVVGTVRYFYPWGAGGIKYAPYWIEFSVQANPYGYTAATANAVALCGNCKLEKGIKGGTYLGRSSSDDTNIYDDLYAFDPDHIYFLRAKVPQQSSLGDFQDRWQQAQDVFAHMTGSISLAPENSRGASGYGPVLFLNGSDLWAANTRGSNAAPRPITRGYVVRQFALAPDLRHIVFSATNDDRDRFAEAHYTYIADAEGEGPVTPQLLNAGLTIYDLAWYGDRSIIAIGRSGKDPLGIYSMAINLSGAPGGGSIETTPRLLTQLPGDMTAAKALAVSPDRQLITFLAPLGETKGTDIYALRPDGSDLRKVVSHTDPAPPEMSGEDALTQENQAIKSYTWLGGRLENGKYYLNLLLTCGTFSSPTLYPGGFVYTAANSASGTLLDPAQLNLEDPTQVQIVHIASSPQGKVALSGFYILRDNRFEVLAGLWTADLIGGSLVNLKQQPVPASPNGISDLQWSPDGKSLIYRETLPRDTSSMISRYEGDTEFKLISLSPESGQVTTLYDTTRH